MQEKSCAIKDADIAIKYKLSNDSDELLKNLKLKQAYNIHIHLYIAHVAEEM
jgi:hypothetical protein